MKTGSKGLNKHFHEIHLAGEPPVPLPPLAEVEQPPLRPQANASKKWPWENLAFEGGGVKGIAYCGALDVLEAEGVYPQHIRRVAGSSIGSLVAMLVALGYTTKELIDLLKKTDLAHTMQDASWGMFGGLFNIFRSFGMNPGKRLHDLVGQQLERRLGSKEATFTQLLERTGRELCVPVTNVSRMCTEYCHPKTTPNLPVRVAVCMSMALPVLMRPYRIVRGFGANQKRWNEDDIYTDGGLLCNFPVHAFDGWWLSMRPEDTFLRRLQPVSDIARLSDPVVAFAGRNAKTLGFTTFNHDDRDLTAAWAVENVVPPARPATKLALKRKGKEQELQRRSEQAAKVEEAFARLVTAMTEIEKDGDGRISREEFRDLFKSGQFKREDAIQLFGTADVNEVFARLDITKDGMIDVGEIYCFMDAINVDLMSRANANCRTQSTSMGSFMHNLLETLLLNMQRTGIRAEDKSRTIPIDTDYIGTADFDCVEADFEFMIESARRQTRAFLKRLEQQEQ